MALPKTTKRNIKIQLIARYRASGRLLDKQIAELVGMTPPGLAYLIKSPEYLEEENALMEGRLSDMDEALAGDVDAIRMSFKAAVPAAAKTLIDIVLQKRDLRASLAAAKEILDRDPDRTLSAQRVVTAPGEGNGAGGAFNPSAAGSVIASMTAESDKVTVQISTAPAAPISPSKSDVVLPTMAPMSGASPSGEHDA